MENLEDLATLDSDIATHIKETCDIESAVETLQEDITMLRNRSFKTRETTKKTTKQKSVPWWTKELTIKRKRLNALRRLYQRTENNYELREHRKNIYHEEKTKYQAKIKKGKIKIVERIL
jgi:predicted  nucleic acid-binding Zn-ribbon protein